MDLHKLFLTPRPDGTGLFDLFLTECQKWYDQPAHTFTEMRTRDNKKIRGDVFEEFCVQYLKHVRKLTNVWLLKDVPEELLSTLSLKRPDVGIDIVAEKDGKYYAVQCKYKKESPRSQVTWRELATFQGLCAKTGPYEKHIVMTTAHSVRHQGAKIAKDLSICLAGLRGISSEEWVKMCGLTGNTIGNVTAPLSQEELRQARLTRFGSL